MADNKKTDTKKKFISEQDMWELSMDMVGDDTIDSDNRSNHETVDRSAKPVPTRQTSRAKTAPIANTKNKPVVNRTAAKTKTSINPHSNTQPVKPSPVARQANAPRKPATTTNAQQQAKASAMAAKQRNAQVAAKRQATKTQQSQNKQHSVDMSRESDQPQRRKQASYREENSSPAVFTTREVNSRVSPQKFDEIKKIKRKEKFIKIASMFWSVFDMAWMIIINTVKFVIGSLPFVYRHKLIISVSVVSFSLGFVVASMSGSATDANVKQTTPLTQSQTKTKKAKSKQSNVNKTKLKKNSTQAKKSKKQNTIVKKASPGQEVSQEKNQFYGRDILFEEVDPNTVKADFADEANTSVGDDQGSLIAPDLNDTQAQNNEIKAEVEALINDQIKQGQIDEISRNIDVDAVQNDMAKITNNEGQQANKNQEVVKAQNENPELTRLLENNFNDYKNKQWDLVISNSTEIIKIDPSIIDAYINRSIAYTETGAIDKAISDANKAIMLNPRNPLAINNRGYAYEKSGDINNAIADYQAACNLGISISCSEVRRLRNENNTTE